MPRTPADLHVWSRPAADPVPRPAPSATACCVRGDAGWGEFSPFWDYDAAESAAWWRAAREAADEGWPRAGARRGSPSTSPSRRSTPRPRTGSCARPAGAGRRRSRSPSPGSRSPTRSPASRPSATRSGPTGPIRVDANAAWDVDTAVTRLVALDRAAGGLEYAEQPVPTRRRPRRRCAGARTCRSRPTSRSGAPQDPLAVARAHAADVVVLKVQPLGGVRACLELAERIGLPVVVSSALESSVGLAAGDRARGGAAGAALRVRARHRPAVHGRPGRPTRSCRSTARSPSAARSPTPRLLAAAAAPDDARRPVAPRGSRAVERSGMMAGVTTPRPAPTRRRRRPGCSSRRSRPSASRTSCSPRAPAAHRSPTRSRTPPRPTTSARPARPALRLHVRVDERSAAFLALGLVRASALGPAASRVPRARSRSSPRRARPSPTCTRPSSRRTTAACRCSLLTADRPHELRGTGANQTTEQVGIFGGAVRLARRRARHPSGCPTRRATCAAIVARAVAAATGARTGDPGPVHLNLAFREPLVPGRRAVAGAVDRGPHARRRPGPATGAVPRRRRAVGAARRRAAAGCRPCWSPGTAPARPRAGSRRRTAGRCWPSRRPARAAAPHAIAAYRLLLAHPRLGGAVRRVVVLGRPTLSRPVQRLLARAGRRGRRRSRRAAPTGPTPPATPSDVLLEAPARMRQGRMPRAGRLARRVAGRRRGGRRARSTSVLDGLDAGRRVAQRDPRDRAGARPRGRPGERRRRRARGRLVEPRARPRPGGPLGRAAGGPGQPRARGHRRHGLDRGRRRARAARTAGSARCSAT